MFNRKIRQDDMPAVAAELEEVRKQAGGLLVPRDVVHSARNKNSKLHQYFTWDDSEAAGLYRQEQARALIRVVVVTVDGDGEAIEAYISLSSDQKSGRGYRHIIDVLDDDDLQQQMLADALTDLGRWKDRYAQVRKLADLRSTITAGVKKVNRKRSKKARKKEAVASPG